MSRLLSNLISLYQACLSFHKKLRNLNPANMSEPSSAYCTVIWMDLRVDCAKLLQQLTLMNTLTSLTLSCVLQKDFQKAVYS